METEIITLELQKHEAVIERGLNTFVEVGQALSAIRDARLYRLDFDNFEDYCQARWGFNRNNAFMLIQSSKVVDNLFEQHVVQIPANARQALPLASLSPSQQSEAWQRVVDTAPEGKITAAYVQQVVNSIQKKLREGVRREQRKDELIEVATKYKYGRDDFKLLHGDFRDMMIGIKCDVIITDPPYSKEYIPLYSDLARLAKQSLKAGGLMVVMCGHSYLNEIYRLFDEHLTYLWTAAYLTPGGQAVQIFPRRAITTWKPLLIYCNGKYTGKWYGDVAKSPVNNNDKEYHEWGQSEAGMEDIIERWSNVGEIILDPFCGAGTTGVIANLMKRGFIGIDVDSNNLKITEGRILCQK